MKTDRIAEIVEDIKFGPWEFFVGGKGDGVYLQVRFSAPGLAGEAAARRYGRKFLVTDDMTEGEVVALAYYAVVSEIECEARRMFTYKGTALFSPAVPVEAQLAAAGHVETGESLDG